MVPFVSFEMVGEIPDPFAEKSNLNLRRPGILLMVFKLFDNLFLLFLDQHSTPPDVGMVPWCEPLDSPA
jgi:hypothetical protein